MTESEMYPITKIFAAHTLMNEQQYQTLYSQSIKDPNSFWADQAQQHLTWFKPWSEVLTGSFSDLNVRWFVDGKLNVSFNCLDRHLAERANQIAIIWEGDDPAQSQQITYRELHEQVCRFANVLKQQGVKKGDRVCIYMPMIPEAAIAMLACTRIGAIHSVVFGGFSAESLKTRVLDAECCMVITANEGLRGQKKIPLKQNVDKALTECPSVKKVVIVKRTDQQIAWIENRDIWWHEAMENISSECAPEEMDANDPLFILYTSGSTGKPKGILHGTGGYLLQAAMTHRYIFDYRDGDIFWCTADVGWITGHTYTVYGPLVNGGTTLMFEGVPNYPTPARFWEVIDKHQVTIFYTAPTAIRALRREGDRWVQQTKRKSLRLLGTVGEPINPEAWKWYYDVVGEQRCPIVDTWWQTETGGIMISPLPGATPLKPGSAAWPFFGVVPEIVNDQGQPVAVNVMGNLIIKQPWPGMMQTVYRNPERFEMYFETFPGNYLTGDQAHKDQDGYFWISGRNDDVLKISGHRVGTEEVESALVSNTNVSEAAVVGIPDDIKGQTIYAYVTLKSGIKGTDELKKNLVATVRDQIGAIATIADIQWVDGLPKTRSGKIMRRLLRKIAVNDTSDLGDLSTLADPSVIDDIIRQKK